jgi:hypothetical protein
MGALEISTLAGGAVAWHPVRVLRAEYRAVAVGAVAYLVVDALLLYRQPGTWGAWGFLRYSPMEQQHAALMYVILAIAALGLLTTPPREEHIATAAAATADDVPPTRFPMLCFVLCFAFFVARHPQPNELGNLMHLAAAAFVLLHGACRAAGDRAAAGASLVVAGYVFFYGQYGIAVGLEERRVQPVAALLTVVAAGVVAAAAYHVAFAAPEAPARAWARRRVRASSGRGAQAGGGLLAAGLVAALLGPKNPAGYEAVSPEEVRSEEDLHRDDGPQEAVESAADEIAMSLV